MGLATLIQNSINSHIGQLNTLMLCKVTQVVPFIKLISYFDMGYEDGSTSARTEIQDPILLEGATYKVGDVVLTGFLQEFVEGGATRKFDISDAVIIGKVQI
jgi:hypothetical protein